MILTMFVTVTGNDVHSVSGQNVVPHVAFEHIRRFIVKAGKAGWWIADVDNDERKIYRHYTFQRKIQKYERVTES